MRFDPEQILRELQEMRRRITQKPDIIVVPPLPYRTVLIVDGNTLETGEDGVLYETGTIASVPSAYDPNTEDTFIDGIGRGILFENGVMVDGYVLVVNDDRGSFRNASRYDDVVYSGHAVNIPVDGGGSVIAYTLG